MKWFWGLLLIVVGLIALGNTTGYLSEGEIVEVLRFWPLLLIIFGIAIIFRRWMLGWLVVLLAFIAAILFIYLARFSPQPLIDRDIVVRNENQQSVSRFSTGLPQNINSTEITINTGAVDMDLNGTNNKLIEGQMRSGVLSPQLNVKTENNKAMATLETTANSPSWRKVKNKLDVSITNKIPVDLSINSGASKMDMDLSDIILSSLDIDTGATSIDLVIGNQISNNTQISVDAGASSIDMTLPKDIGVEIRTDGALSSYDFENFDKQNGNVWLSRNYSSASKKIILTFNTGVSSIDVHQR